MNPAQDKNFNNFVQFVKFRKRDTMFYLCSERYINACMYDSTPKEYQRAYEVVKDILEDIEKSKRHGK
jgi:hypothetical protein